jgi:nucleoside-diphosphate-sugar epimerase
VQESIVFLYPDSGDRWIDATTTEPDPSVNAASALAAEAQAARVTEAGGAGVVLRFGMFYGPGVYHTEAFLRMARWGLPYGAGAAGGYMSMVHVDDAAAAVVAALDAPAGIYDVVDDEPLTSADFATALAAAVGRRRHVRVPGRLMRLGGRQVESLVRSQRVSNRRFREATGWAPQHPDVRSGLAAVVGEVRTGRRGAGPRGPRPASGAP